MPTAAPRLPVARKAIWYAVRGWFAVASFIKVETSALQASPGNEAHLSPFVTEAVLPDGERQDIYLLTSPEYAHKEL